MTRAKEYSQYHGMHATEQTMNSILREFPADSAGQSAMLSRKADSDIDTSVIGGS